MNRVMRMALVATVFAACIALGSTGPRRAVAAITLVVNSTGDGHDAVPGDGTCQTATAGECTLRAAMEEANALPGADVIDFAIGGPAPHIIQVNDSGNGFTPSITTQITIDATTQPDWTTSNPVVIDGTLDPGPSNGVGVAPGGELSVIKGLLIQHFVNGIGLFNAGQVTLDANNLRNNSNAGLSIWHSPNNTVGVTTGNVISGNPNNGIWIYGLDSSGNVIQQNAIGTDLSRSIADGNGTGVLIQDAPGNQIGVPGSGNVISGNKSVGVQVAGDGATTNRLQKNLIGTDITGMAAIPNGMDDVVIGDGAADNVVGGTGDVGNVISGSPLAGVVIQGTAAGEATGNVVANNWIGTNANETGAIPNGIGVVVAGANAHDNKIGTTDVDGRNYIMGNGSVGLELFGGAYQNTVENNWIGFHISNGVQFTNGTGIAVLAGAHDNRIGGELAAANEIVGNNGPGVGVGDDSVHNSIRRNRISQNGTPSVPALGIDLLQGGQPGVTHNDPQDADSGPNNLQNFPALTQVMVNGGGTSRVIGSLHSTPDSSFDIDFFDTYLDGGCDPSGHGEGGRYVGSITLQTDALGNLAFDLEFLAFTVPGSAMTATATSAAGDTSEFSACTTAISGRIDSDGDGCPDAKELGPDWRLGGQRDNWNPWDEFDVPVPPLTAANPTGMRNRAITIQDVLAIVFYIGTASGGPANANGVMYDSDVDANGVPDGREYDRTPGQPPDDFPWRSDFPNGSVSLQDALVALGQVGTNCN